MYNRIMKRIFKAIWNQFIYGGHLVSLGPIVIVLISSTINKININFYFYIIFYLIPFGEYLFDRYLGIGADTTDNPARTKYLLSYKKFIPFILIVCFLLTWIVASSQGLLIFILVLILQALGVLYSLNIKKITKKIVGFKNFYIAISFPLVIIVLILQNKNFSISLLLLYFFFVSRLLFSTTFYDIKDLLSDRQNGLKTFPVVLQKNRLIIFLKSVNLLSVLIIIVGVTFLSLPKISLVYTLTSFYSAYYLWLWEKNRSTIDKLSNLWCDGEFVLWLVILLMTKIIWK